MPDPEEPWSQLGLAEDQAIYASPTQNVRAISEHWAAASLFCPACGTAPLDKARANARVLDFSCAACREEYEPNAPKGRIDHQPTNRAPRPRQRLRHGPSVFFAKGLGPHPLTQCPPSPNPLDISRCNRALLTPQNPRPSPRPYPSSSQAQTFRRSRRCSRNPGPPIAMSG